MGNPGSDLDLEWVNKSSINLTAVNNYAKELISTKSLTGAYRAAWLLKAVTLIDLTTLAGDDTASNVSRLCFKASKPIAEDLLEELGFSYDDESSKIHTAAVCVYPSKVECAASTLSKLELTDRINVASVATGFPSGQMPLHTRLDEIRFAVAQGATEIDIVLDRSLVITGKWRQVYEELKQMKEACGPKTHMKAILATGELETLTTVYKASLVAMMAGSDFIKTSTGKESVNATLQFGIVMAYAIRDYEDKFNYKVGLKPAGGIRTSQDAINWLIMVKAVLGDAWLHPKLFRFGASGLLGDIECNLFEFVTGEKADPNRFSMG